MTQINQALKLACSCILTLCLGGLSLHTHANGFDYSPKSSTWGGNDEDTILVESGADAKISYSKAVKAACKNLLGLDIDKYFSGGKNKSSEVIRQLNDLAERTHYGLRLEQEEITFSFKLNL